MQHFEDLGHSFLPYGTPSRQIEYMYLYGSEEFCFEDRQCTTYFVVVEAKVKPILS